LARRPQQAAGLRARPKDIDARTEAGHWEGDVIICKRTRPVLVLHERKSRVTLAMRLAGKTAAETIFARIEPALRGDEGLRLWLPNT
jgi:IS30 family transposase